MLEGEDVQQLARRLGPMPHDLALRIAAQACLGLEKAHEQNIVHRDIKPANLFLTKGPGSERIIKLLTPAASSGTPAANSGAPAGSAGAPSGKSGPLPAASDKRPPVVGPRPSASADIFVDR